MRSVLYLALAGFLAVFVVASPKPASALAATAAIDHNQAKPSNVEQVRRWYRKRYRPYRYSRRPYYQPYYYRRPYYRPYYGYNRPYRYYRRPRVGVYVGI